MKYNTFLCYNSKLVEDVTVIYEYLINSGLRVFFDRQSLPAGRRFQKELEEALRDSESFIVIIGPAGLGPWQEEENYIFQMLSVKSTQNLPIIPVFLPGANTTLQLKEIPLFLQSYNAFSFKSSVHDVNELYQLMQAIPQSQLVFGELERPFLRQEQDKLLANTVRFYDKEATRYYETWKDNLPLAPIYAFLTELRRKGKSTKILDAGCGPGHHSKYFASEGQRVTGIDLSQESLKIADKAKTGECRFIIADMRDLQQVFPDRNVFDGVWACASCLHLSKEGFTNQLYQFTAVLKPEGVLGMSFQVGLPSMIQDDGRFFERYDEKDLLSRLERHAFRVVNINTQITARNTLEKKQVKKWLNVVAVAPNAKERLRLGGA